jgi:hypothetical protein
VALGLGSGNPFPLTLGGGESIEDIELEALLDAYAPGWDRDSETANYAECLAHAQIIATIWAANARLANQAVPERMVDVLEDWESILRLRPGPNSTEVDRRALVSAALRGLAGNTISDITETCSTLMGANFDEIVTADPADEITYWPGINPGPPGYEWSTTRLCLAVRVNRTGLNDAQYTDKTNALARALDIMLPAWMTFAIGTGDDGFLCDVDIVDLDFL